ncbi:MAG: type IX secretion system sortase PorU [Muribaculaceae bacterium]|nr:type IX secretion system sortase PorU [Muribaculaceae bacterium]
MTLTSKIKGYLSALLLCIGLMAHAYSPTYYSSTSRLSTGRWVKVKVTKTGIQQITHQELAEMGFNDPSAVSVYGYGGVLVKNTFDVDLPDDIIAQPVMRTADKILFYGEGDVKTTLNSDLFKVNIHRNTYSSAGYYFLSDSRPGESTEPSIILSNNSIVEDRSTHQSVRYWEEELTCPAMGGARFFGPDMVSTSNHLTAFVAEKADTTKNGQFNFAWAIASNTQVLARLVTNGLTVVNQSNPAVSAALYSNSEYYYNSKAGYVTVKMKEDNDSLYALNLMIPSEYSFDFAAMDYVTFSYTRKNDFAQCAQLPMVFDNVSSRTSFTLRNVNANVQVWNVTSPINVFAYRTAYDSEAQTMKSAFERKYTPDNNGHAYLIAFDPYQTQYSVEYAGEVKNQNLHSLSSPDMLIITNKSMMKYATELAEIHRNLQGMSVHVVDQEDVFNEFSSGTPSAMAYRRLAKMFYDRNSSRFKYLLLYGAGHYDNRGIIFDHADKLLTYQCETANEMHDKSRVYCADSYFGFMHDGYDPTRIHFANIDIAVSRIPADREDKAIVANNKSRNHLLNPPTTDATNRVLLMADRGDLNSHMKQAETNADSIRSLAPNITVTKAYKSLYPLADDAKDCKYVRQAIIQSLLEGQYYMCYTGHGAPETFSDGNLWSKSWTNETDYNYYPIGFFATCDALSFDRADDGIAETMLFKDKGGVITAVAASRTVYKDYNQLYSLAFSNNLFSKMVPGDRTGDLYRKARASAMQHGINASYAKIGINNLCYNMIGDPALPLPVANRVAKVTKVNQTDIFDNDSVAVYPRGENIIKGTIQLANGQLDDTFNGTITFSLYDAPVDALTYNHKDDEIITITRDELLLAQTVATVVNGLFEAKLNIPMPQYLGTNRLGIYAVDKENNNAAQGYLNTIKVMSYDSEQAVEDSIAPVIDEMYLNDRSFRNGDNVSQNVTLYATILNDESGLNVSSAIGAGMRLTIDDSHSYNIGGAATTDANGVTTLKYDIENIEDGHHTLSLSLADNAGNSVVETVSFYVTNNSVSSTLEVEQSVVRTETTINLVHNFNSQPTGRLIIIDQNGNQVLAVNDCVMPYTWNLKDSNGQLVPDGEYYCYAILNAENQYSSTPKVKITVIKQ